MRATCTVIGGSASCYDSSCQVHAYCMPTACPAHACHMLDACLPRAYRIPLPHTSRMPADSSAPAYRSTLPTECRRPNGNRVLCPSHAYAHATSCVQQSRPRHAFRRRARSSAHRRAFGNNYPNHNYIGHAYLVMTAALVAAPIVVRLDITKKGVTI